MKLINYIILVLIAVSTLTYCNKSDSTEGNIRQISYEDSIKIRDYEEKYHELYIIDQEIALSYIVKALNIHLVYNDSIGIAQIYSTIGDYYSQINDSTNALAYYNLALNIFIALDTPYFIGNTLQSIGDWHDDSTSILYKKLAIKEYQRADDYYAIGWTLAEISRQYYNIKSYDSSKYYHTYAISIFVENGDFGNVASTYYNYGLNCVPKDDFVSQIRYYLKAKIITDSLNLVFSSCINDQALAKSYFGLEMYDSCIYFSKLAINLINDSNLSKDSTIITSIFNIYLINKTLSICYEKLGMTKNQVASQKEVIKAQDSINKTNFINDRLKISKLLYNYELSKKETELQVKSVIAISSKLKARNYLILSVSLCVVLLLSTAFIIQQRKLAKRKLYFHNQKIKSLLSIQELKSINAMVEGQEDERKRIAEDLHDRVGSILSTVKLYFNSLNTKIDTHQVENNQQFDKANTLLDEAVQEVRRISHNLVSGLLMKFGLVPALRDLCETVEGAQQIKVHLQMHGIDERLDNQIEISLYRIIQELISNILKHAKATEITVSITRQDGNLNILVEDNGKGFDTNLVYEGMGLKNIRSRVEKLNGKINFDSVIDRGTIVNIDVPMKHNDNIEAD